MKKLFGRKVILFSFVSSFVCLESLGFSEAASKQKKKKILYAVSKKKPTGIFWPMYTLKLLGLHLSIGACCLFTDGEIQVQ